MELLLREACVDDCAAIHKMQVESFSELLHKYKDFETNPGAEAMDKIISRMNQDYSDYYLIMLEDKKIGAIRVVRLPNQICILSQLFILPEYWGKGFAQQAIIKLEALYPKAKGWQLDTIKEETELCHLYEKMGYKKTNREKVIQEGMTLIDYEK